MMTPAVALVQLLTAMGLGAGLGLCYDFLRPLRRQNLRDALFLLCLGAAAVHLSFGVCGGDLRFALLPGMALGGFGWEWTLGRLVRPAFGSFWEFWRRAGKTFWGGAKNFFKKVKNLFPSGGKWVTIK